MSESKNVSDANVEVIEAEPVETDAVRYTAEDYQDVPGGLFKKGNPGRPKGSVVRRKLSEHFVSDVQKLWKAHGYKILLAAAKKNPLGIAMLVARVANPDDLEEPEINGRTLDEETRVRLATALNDVLNEGAAKPDVIEAKPRRSRKAAKLLGVSSQN